jgi:REP element-mobilizing transposase RayT
MTYNPKIHHRRSIRLKGYDYAQSGLYFVTICVQNRACLFGDIVDNEMIMNDAGKMIEKWYFELENKYPNMKCHEYIIMPNHFHCIIEITNTHAHDTHGDVHASDVHASDVHAGTSQRGRPDNDGRSKSSYGPNNKKYGASLFDIMDWFKTMTTNEYIRGVKNKNWPRFDKRLWQLRYWDHIIRNQNDHTRISNYIINNPANWDGDKLKNNSENKNPSER